MYAEGLAIFAEQPETGQLFPISSIHLSTIVHPLLLYFVTIEKDKLLAGFSFMSATGCLSCPSAQNSHFLPKEGPFPRHPFLPFSDINRRRTCPNKKKFLPRSRRYAGPSCAEYTHCVATGLQSVSFRGREGPILSCPFVVVVLLSRFCSRDSPIMQQRHAISCVKCCD